MNKLFVIRFRILHDYIVSTWSGWSEEAAREKMKNNPEWTFSLAEDNDVHKIWDAR